MSKVIPFDAERPEVRSWIDFIMIRKPIQNLTEDEVVTTLRLQHLYYQMRDSDAVFDVTVYQNDNRLEDLTDEELFLAALLDTNCRGLLLGFKRLHYCFGGNEGRWRKIVKACPIIKTQSRMEHAGGGRYYGKGWVIAPHIVTLRKWLFENVGNIEERNICKG